MSNPHLEVRIGDWSYRADEIGVSLTGWVDGTEKDIFWLEYGDHLSWLAVASRYQAATLPVAAALALGACAFL